MRDTLLSALAAAWIGSAAGALLSNATLGWWAAWVSAGGSLVLLIVWRYRR